MFNNELVDRIFAKLLEKCRKGKLGICCPTTDPRRPRRTLEDIGVEMTVRLSLAGLAAVLTVFKSDSDVEMIESLSEDFEQQGDAPRKKRRLAIDPELLSSIPGHIVRCSLPLSFALTDEMFRCLSLQQAPAPVPTARFRLH